MAPATTPNPGPYDLGPFQELKAIQWGESLDCSIFQASVTISFAGDWFGKNNSPSVPCGPTRDPSPTNNLVEYLIVVTTTGPNFDGARPYTWTYRQISDGALLDMAAFNALSAQCFTNNPTQDFFWFGGPSVTAPNPGFDLYENNCIGPALANVGSVTFRLYENLGRGFANLSYPAWDGSPIEVIACP